MKNDTNVLSRGYYSGRRASKPRCVGTQQNDFTCMPTQLLKEQNYLFLCSILHGYIQNTKHLNLFPLHELNHRTSMIKQLSS